MSINSLHRMRQDRRPGELYVSGHGTGSGEWGTMDAKAMWSVAGLAFDLVGAFLLSVPLIWNIDSLIRLTEAQCQVVRKGVVKTVREGAVSPKFAAWATGSLLLLGLASGGAVAYALYPKLVSWVGGTHGVLPTLVGMVAGWFISVAILAVMAGGLAGFLRWVRRGQHERRVGQVGFLLLCLGFVCQAVVNFL